MGFLPLSTVVNLQFENSPQDHERLDVIPRARMIRVDKRIDPVNSRDGEHMEVDDTCHSDGSSNCGLRRVVVKFEADGESIPEDCYDVPQSRDGNPDVCCFGEPSEAIDNA